MENSETSRPRTCAKNATTHPGDIVLLAQGKQRSKAEKAADDKQLKDTLAAKEQARMRGIAHLADMEMEMEAKQATRKKLAPTGKLTSAANHVGHPHADDQDVVPIPRKAAGIKSLKEQINVAKAQHQLEAMKQEDASHHICMLMLTRSTLFFRDLALTTRAKNSTLEGQIQKWNASVTAAKSPATSSADSSSRRPPSTLTFHSLTTQSSDATSLSNHRIALQSPSIDMPELDDATEAFADTVDNEIEHAHTVHKDERGWNAKKVVVISPASADSDVKLNDKIIVSTECHAKEGSVTGKRKAEEVDILYDSEPDEVDMPSYETETNDPMPRDVEDAHRMPCKENGILRTTASTSVGVIHEPLKPQQKKIKVEETKYTIVPPPNLSPMDAVFSTSDASTPAMLQYDEDGYIIEIKKKKYTIKDLPVPSNDSCVEHRVPSCQVQGRGRRFSDGNLEGLLEDYAFLCETPGEPSSEGMFRSLFLIELLGTAHLNDIMGYVNTQLNTKELTAGKDMAGVIGMASAALEHAVKYIVDGIIDVDKVLAHMMEVGDGKIRFKLPRVLNKATGKNTSMSFNFSWSNWGVESMAYRDSIAKHGPEWLRATIEIAQRARQLKVAATSSAATDDHGMDGVNPRALLLTAAQQFK
ncbi:hypothetical protein PISMIDRAFT_23852 [Pisolithus microcarpus 441]|uniref:Uncharacterized protein n=1 Tax=Pisolithus microcarpus 441 TaxID=765257 RepID=A0A0C9Z744_9AGAM|nr:hypothetical protein BKA83DRAFT_23852 [Pisolithus microcarpus]KIK21859.1 hypothetical protein PISMIDRAFT_23852 [Pisolithus microcarpus 441]